MGLRETAETDLGIILEDEATGFGWPITVTDPAGAFAVLVGSATDIAQVIDADTGEVVSGRLAEITLRISQLILNGLGLPEGIADSSKKPWLVAFKDINGNQHTFKVAQSDPDRAIGAVVCKLESYTL